MNVLAKYFPPIVDEAFSETEFEVLLASLSVALLLFAFFGLLADCLLFDGSSVTQHRHSQQRISEGDSSKDKEAVSESDEKE